MLEGLRSAGRGQSGKRGTAGQRAPRECPGLQKQGRACWGAWSSAARSPQICRPEPGIGLAGWLFQRLWGGPFLPLQSGWKPQLI